MTKFRKNQRLELVMTAVSLCLGFVLAAPIAYADNASSTPPTTQINTPDTQATSTTPSNTPTTPPAPPAGDPVASTTTPVQPTASTNATSTATSTASSDPSITTGNASSSSEVNTKVNVNQTTTGNASTTVSNTNVASTTSDTSSSASTGSNTIVSSGSASISTGNAISQANVINVVNTNITNSQGLLEFLNAFNARGYNFDKLDLSYFENSLSSSTCSFFSCNGASLKVNNSNTATVNNAVISKASTGDNDASSTSGDANISTGNAAASANVVNVINTNITNSHYFLVALNNFGDLAGNIVLPSASFFDRIMSQYAKTGSTTVLNDNTAILNSTTTAEADTGDNAGFTRDANISTGSAYSNATTYNQTNMNLTGGTTVFMLINVFGNWTGNIQGLPSGLSWMQTQNGVSITGDAGALSSLSSGTDSTSSPRATTASTTNNATVNNNVQVYALTGQNQAANASGTAAIATGNAYASANIVNLINTNVLGQNWILAIMNIFGNWSGNLDFGQPDLWIGAEAQTSNPTQPGSQVVYTFTIANHGDVDSTNVILKAHFDPTMLAFDSGTTGTGAQWNLGTIPAGQTKQFSYTAKAGTPSGGSIVAVPLVATVTEDQDDANVTDNTDTVTIAVGTQFSSSSGGLDIGRYQDDPKLIVHKTASIAHTSAPATVNYTVTVRDPVTAGPAYNAILTDTLTGPDGTVSYKNSWELDTINPGDYIKLTYSIKFDASTTPGAYLDTSQVTGEENYPKDPYANPMPTATAVSSLEIDPTGQVLGASTSTAQCSPLLTSYLTIGGINSSGQVSALQWFLNRFENTTLKVTGIYDQATSDAVKAFQKKYASDILVPWGMSEASGNVYYTTEEQINNIVCGTDRFTLTAAQENEINKFKSAGTGTYGVAPSHKHVTLKEPPQPIVQQSLPLPVVVAPEQPASSTFLGDFVRQVSSVFAVPFAQAQSRD